MTIITNHYQFADPVCQMKVTKGRKVPPNQFKESSPFFYLKNS